MLVTDTTVGLERQESGVVSCTKRHAACCLCMTVTLLSNVEATADMLTRYMETTRVVFPSNIVPKSPTCQHRCLLTVYTI